VSQLVNFGGLEFCSVGFAPGLSIFYVSSPVLGEAEGAGFGFNLDLLNSNVLNLAIIIGVLVYFGRGFLGKILSERQSQIETAIREAEERKQTAVAALAGEQQKLAQAKSEAVRIREAAEQSAEKAKAAIIAETEVELVRMRQSASQDITSQEERIARELRSRIAVLAIEKAEEQLKATLTPDAQGQLVDQSIQFLEGRA
jgi:F-type H+-transporting ATPase subunit b